MIAKLTFSLSKKNVYTCNYVLMKLTVFIYVGKTNGYQMFYAIKMHYPFYILVVFELHVHIKRPFKKKDLL